MKTQGSFHEQHALAFHMANAIDAIKQLQQKLAREEARFRAKLKRALRNHKSAKADSREISIDPELAKFPPLEIGISIWRTNIVDWGWEQIGPPSPQWQTFRQGQNAILEIEELLARIRDRHAGYVSRSGKVEFYQTPKEYVAIGMAPYDDMIFSSSVTTPAWDSDALSESLRAGEVSREEFEGMILEPLYEFFSGGKLERLISRGAVRGLVYLGVDVHCENGTLHFHARFLRSAPLGFRDEAGVIHPRSSAPDRGRRKQGAGWVGGETLGLRGNTGKLISNSLGVTFCATDALRKEGFLPPCDYGNNWGKLEREIAARKAAHGMPFDLVASRFLRGLIRLLARNNPAFKKRRERKLAEAKAKDRDERKMLAEIFAGELLEKKDAEIVAVMLPEWLEVVRKNMCGDPVPHAKIANTRHVSGRLVLQGGAEVAFVRKHFPEHQTAKQLQEMLAAHAAALAGYDADAAKHGIARAEKKLASLEAGWRQKYIQTEPPPVKVVENHIPLKESLRSAEDVRFVTTTIVAAFQRHSAEPEGFTLTPCERRFIKVEPSTKIPRIRRDIFNSFMSLAQENNVTITTMTDLEQARRVTDSIAALKEGFSTLLPLSAPPMEEPSAPDISEIEDARHTVEP